MSSAHDVPDAPAAAPQVPGTGAAGESSAPTVRELPLAAASRRLRMKGETREQLRERMRAMARRSVELRRAAKQLGEKRAVRVDGRPVPRSENAYSRDAHRIAALALALPPARLRSLAERTIARLEQLLDATNRQPVVRDGAVVDHVEVPDNPTRLRAVAEALVLLGVKGPATRGAGAPQRLEVRVAQFGAPPDTARQLVDVTAQDVTPQESSASDEVTSSLSSWQSPEAGAQPGSADGPDRAYGPETAPGSEIWRPPLGG